MASTRCMILLLRDQVGYLSLTSKFLQRKHKGKNSSEQGKSHGSDKHRAEVCCGGVVSFIQSVVFSSIT